MTSRQRPHPRPALRARPDRRRHRPAGRRAPRLHDRRRRRHRSGQGRPRPRRRRRASAEAAAASRSRTTRQGAQGGQARRRRAVHQLVDQEGDAADRGDPEAEGADRLDDRGAGVSRLHAHPARARQIHALAKKAKVAVLGTGVNPGFAMDALPIALTARLRAGRSRSSSIASRTRASAGCRSSRRSAPASRASSSSRRSTTAACGTSG